MLIIIKLINKQKVENLKSLKKDIIGRTPIISYVHSCGLEKP